MGRGGLAAPGRRLVLSSILPPAGYQSFLFVRLKYFKKFSTRIALLTGEEIY